MSEDIELGVQPHCATCGTVLRDRGVGYFCPNCKLVFLNRPYWGAAES